MSQQTQYRIILFYVFTQLADPEAVRLWQFTLAQSLGLRGRVIVSVHGINATLGGELGAIKTYVRALKGYAPFRGADVKWFQGTGEDFPRLLTQRKCGGGEMVTSCADLRIAQQMDPRSMSVDLSREGDEYVPEANLPGIDSESIELGGRPAAHRPRGQAAQSATAGAKWFTAERPPGAIHAAAGPGARHRQRQRHRQLRPGHPAGGDAHRAARRPERSPRSSLLPDSGHSALRLRRSWRAL